MTLYLGLLEGGRVGGERGGGASHKDHTVPCTSIHCLGSQQGKQDQ